MLELLKSYFEIVDEDDDSRRSEKVEAKVRALDPGARGDAAFYILSLLGISSAGCVTGDDGCSDTDAGARWRRSSASSSVKRLLKQPLVVIFEDLHWIDAATRPRSF